MPWWSWIVIWIALVALALLYVILLGLKVWRGANKTMRSISGVGQNLTDRWESQSVLAAEQWLTASSTETQGEAVFATPEQMKDDYLASKKQRSFARLNRRVARRNERGQLQSWRDIKALEDVK